MKTIDGDHLMGSSYREDGYIYIGFVNIVNMEPVFKIRFNSRDKYEKFREWVGKNEVFDINNEKD